MATPTYRDYIDDDRGRELLRQFLEPMGDARTERCVPVRIRPAIVQRFLSDTVKPDLKGEAFTKSCDIARFYVQREALALYQPLLKRGERKPGDAWLALHTLWLLADLGDQAQLKLANEYYIYLVKHATTADLTDDLIVSQFHLGEKDAETAITQRLDQRLREIEARDGKQDPPGEEYNGVERQRYSALPLAIAARRRRRGILDDKDAVRRSTALARLYLGLDDYGAVRWPRWAAFESMAELQRSSPTDLVTGLRAALAAISEKDHPADFVKTARARGARAVAFFSGGMTEAEQGWAVQEDVPIAQLQA